MMKRKEMINKILAVAVSAAIVLQSPAFLNRVYAEPSEEGEISLSENITPSDNETVPADSRQPEEGTVSENENESENVIQTEDYPEPEGAEPVSVNAIDLQDGPDGDGQAVVGGYIEMPWDNNTPVADPDLDYKEALENMVEEPSDGEEPAGYVTEPVSIESKFPAGTDSEVLTYLKNKYPATRSQNPYGSCWAHSAVALSEFYMISQGLKDNNGTVDSDVDYSELALAYFCYNQAPDPANGDTGDSIVFDKNAGKRKTFLDFGGNLNFASQSLMRFNGVTNDEDDAAYSNAEAVLAGGLDPSYAASKDTAHLKNAYQINIKENPKLVKQAIKENGIVGVSIYAHDSYMNTEHSAYYNNVDDSTNHAVAVVGWNDDFPKQYFNTQPSKNGAWLVRNSWSEHAGYSYYSYFWLSYEDHSLADTAYVFEMANKDRGEYYDNNYNYDSQLHNLVTADSATVANVFTAAKNAESLKAVQIDSTMNIPGSYTVKVFKNLTDSSNPESGTPAATETGELPFAGKYTIPLTEAVDLSEGEVFSIVVQTDNKIDQESDFTWNEQIVMDTAIHEGESFAKVNGTWKDVVNSSYGGKYGNICIRALTDTKGGSSLPDRISSLLVKNRTDKSISIQWSASNDAEGYEVWYSNAENGTYTKAGTTAASERKYKHTGLSSGTTYFYKVYPIKNGSRYDAGVSPVVSAKTISGTPAVEMTRIGKYTATARWDKLDNCDGYRYRHGSGNSVYGWNNTQDNEVEINYLTPGQEHFIEVMSYTGDPASPSSTSEVCRVDFTTQNGTGSAITNLKAEPYTSDIIKLTWDEQEEVTAYKIEKSTDGVNFTESPTYSPMTDYYDFGLDPNTKYYYRVTSIFRKFGNGNEDTYTSETVSSYTMLPASDVNRPVVTESGITITWSAVTGANYYSIYRREKSAVEYIPLTIVPASGTLQYTDTTPLPGRTYYYRVFGCRTNELTDEQGETGGGYGTRIPLGNVTDFDYSDISSRAATVSWTPVRGAQGYIIKRYDSGTSSFIEQGRTDADTTTYRIVGLLPNTWYQFVVVAFSDETSGGGTGKYFQTTSGDPAQASFFTVTANDCTYDGSAHGASVTCSVNEINTAGYKVSYGKVENGSVSVYSDTVPVDAGTYRIKITTNPSTYYVASGLTDPSWEFTISPKTITPTVTLTPDSFTYTGGDRKPSVTVKNGGTILTEGTDYTVSYSNYINAGTGTVTVTSKTGSNYTFTETTENYTIGKATTAVTIAGGNRSVTYGAGNITLGATASLPGSGTKTWTWSSDNDSAASVNPSTGVVTINGQGQAVITAAYSSNDTEGSGSMTITVRKASLTVTANDNTITYGDAPAGNGVTFSGFVNGDTSSAVTGTVGYTYDYSRYDPKGDSYSITPSGLSAANYDITYVSGTLKVLQKEVGLSWAGKQVLYNGEPQKPTAEATGLVNGDVCTVTVTGGGTTPGEYNATASALSNPNYKLPADNTTSLVISKADYGDKSATGSARYGNTGQTDLGIHIVPGGSLKTTDINISDANNILAGTPSVSGNTLSFSVINDVSKAGKTATVTVIVDGGQNYHDYSIEVTLTVLDKEAQTVTFSGVTGGKVSKMYGDGNFYKTASTEGNGRIDYGTSNTDVALVYSTGEVEIKGAGEAVITATAAATDDYAEGSASYLLSVSKKEIGINWTGDTFTYDGNGHVPEASATGLKSGDTCALTVTGSGTEAGNHVAAVTALSNKNYKLPSAVSKNFVINKKDVRISGITADDKEYDGTTAAVLDLSGVSVNGMVAGDSLSVTASGNFADPGFGTGKTVGIRLNSIVGAKAGNYAFSRTGQQTSATASITKRPVTVKALDQTISFNEAIINDVSKALISGEVEGHTLASVQLSGSPEGQVTNSGIITPSSAVIKNGNETVTGNYDISYENGVLVVLKASHEDEAFSSSALYGTSGTVDLSSALADGASYGSVLITSDPDSLLAGTPAVSGNILSYTFGGTKDDAGKSVVLTVPVNGGSNYEDYSIIITLTLSACSHTEWVLENRKTATCTEKGHTGNKVCKECGTVIEYGKETDIDPDNHDYDEGEETEPATVFREGVRIFTCSRCGHRKQEVIPKLEGSEDIEDIIEDTKDLSGNNAPDVRRTEDEKGNTTETVTIGGKEVSKTVTDKETGRQTVETKIWIGGLESSYCYTGSQIKPAFHVYDGIALLNENTDYTVKYTNNKNAGDAKITVRFKGNYKNAGNVSAKFTIAPAVLGRDVLAGQAAVAAKNSAQKVVPVLTHSLTGKAVSAKSFTCDPKTVKEAGEYDITVRSKDKNYTGQTTMKLKVVGEKKLLLSNARVTFNPGSYPYTGKEVRPAAGSYSVKIGSVTLTEGKDYKVTGLYNNVDPGTATMVFEAVSGNSAGYAGSRSATFRITGKIELGGAGERFYYTCPERVPFAKGGARPSVKVKHGEKTLKEGIDYTLAYSKNKKVTEGKEAKVTVKGKGIYSGSTVINFAVVKQDIGVLSGNIIASDQFAIRSKLKSASVTITDIDGKKLTADKDFEIGDAEDADPGNTDTEGLMKVKVTGTGCYEGNCDVFFRYLKPAGNIKKAKQSKKIPDQTYTGKEIMPDDAVLSGILYLDNKGTRNNLVPGKDFTVAGYSNNIKKGTAKINVKGTGAFGGMKTLTFRIIQKPVDYKGALIGGDWK